MLQGHHIASSSSNPTVSLQPSNSTESLGDVSVLYMKKKKTRVQWQSHDVSLYNKSCHECIRMFQPLRVYKRREFFIGQQIGHSLQDISSILAYFSEDFHIFLRCKAEFLKLNFVVIEKPLVKIPSLCLSLL